MKKLLLSLLVVLYGNAFGQQFPISAANMFSYSGGPSPSLEISTTPGMMKSANFNWGIAGVPITIHRWWKAYSRRPQTTVSS